MAKDIFRVGKKPTSTHGTEAVLRRPARTSLVLGVKCGCLVIRADGIRLIDIAAGHNLDRVR
jgi:hypothetical protein